MAVALPEPLIGVIPLTEPGQLGACAASGVATAGATLRLARSASANSWQLPNRSCGALARARASTASATGSRSGRWMSSDLGGWDRCA